MTYQTNLHEKAVIVQLNCAFSWGTITDQQITDETNHNKGAVRGAMHVKKKLLPAAAGLHVEQVQSILSKFYQFHSKVTYGTPTRGQRLMPCTQHFKYEEAIAEAQAAGSVALNNLVKGFDAAVVQAKALLGSSFNQDDYPSADEIRRYYVLQHRFLPVPSGDAIMKAMGASVAADVDSYVGHILTSAAADAKDRLREAVLRMQERCSAPKGKIYDSLTGAIDELVEQLPEIAGLTQDKELQKWVNEVRQNLTGFDSKGLRENPQMRTDAARAAADIMKRMGG